MVVLQDSASAKRSPLNRISNVTSHPRELCHVAEAEEHHQGAEQEEHHQGAEQEEHQQAAEQEEHQQGAEQEEHQQAAEQEEPQQAAEQEEHQQAAAEQEEHQQDAEEEERQFQLEEEDLKQQPANRCAMLVFCAQSHHMHSVVCTFRCDRACSSTPMQRQPCNTHACCCLLVC